MTDALPISDADRQALQAALVVHRHAGRLDSAEYETRQVAIARAVTWAEIPPLFSDLPDPRPDPQAGPVFGTPGAVTPLPGPRLPEDPRLPEGAVRPARRFTIDPRVARAMPIIALFLFLTTRTWVWFLLVPLVWIFAGNDGRRDDR